ncbi:hypothetical protein HT031_006577 [Scenedesmus sp. PABB004]|nr:hypothetical protein HT031_006577 [Scenedesmus sp. PABB004]
MACRMLCALALACVALAGAADGLSLGADCARAKPTLFLMSGAWRIGGSQMSGSSDGSGGVCPPLNSTVVWWLNSSGTQLWPDEGLPGKQALYYALLVKHLTTQHGYVMGKDFHVIPYDWRVGIQGLKQARRRAPRAAPHRAAPDAGRGARPPAGRDRRGGGMDRIAQRVADGVAGNCGAKAVLITHSFGANIMAHMLHKPELKAWREANVRGWVPVGGPFGGTGATTWMSVLCGDFFKLFPILSNLLRPAVGAKFPITVIGKSVYTFAFGLPSWTFMFPRAATLGADHVVVSTPTRNFTVAEQKELLLTTGNKAGAELLEQSWAMNDAAMAAGPVPGVETFCLYSTAVPTPKTLVFNQSVPERFVMHRPYKIDTTPGDGVVDLASLRLCSKFAPPENMVEVDGPLVDHSTILSHPLGLDGLSSILGRLGAPARGPILFNFLPGRLGR